MKKTSWHQRVKEVLKEIGESRGYDVSESEQEIHFTKRVSIYIGDPIKLHTLTCKPDVVWKKGDKYRAVFQIEHAENGVEKRKYALGNLFLTLISLRKKSWSKLIYVTNNESLCDEIGKFVKFSADWIENLNKIEYHWITGSTSYVRIRKDLQDVDP